MSTTYLNNEENKVEISTGEVQNGVTRTSSDPSEEYAAGDLTDNPLWPDLLAEIAANRQADLERDARDYAE